MSFPANGAIWPPASMETSSRYLATARAWYSAEAPALAKHYGGSKPAGGKTSFWGKVAALFGATKAPVTPGGSVADRAMHVPIATDLAEAYSQMLFSESLTYTWPDGFDASRWDLIADACGWETKLAVAGQRAAGLGDTYLRATWDLDVAPHALIDVIDPGRVVPTFRHGFLTEALLTTEVVDGRVVWRHIERHTAGRVEHALYRGEPGRIGVRVPLTDHELTAGLADSVDEGSGIDTGYDGLAVVHVPALPENTGLSGTSFANDLGKPITQGLEALLDAFDRAWSSLMWELEAGKKRLIVASTLLGEGATFGTETGVYAVPHQPSENENRLPIEAVDFTLRVNEHLAVIDAAFRQIIASAGFSPQTFGLSDGGSGETATAVHARSHGTRELREQATRLWAKPLGRIIEAALAIDATHCGGTIPARPDVLFPAFSTPTLIELAQTVQLLRAAEAASIDTAVRMLHPDWTTEQIAAEVAALQAERGIFTDPAGDLEV